MKLFEKRIKPEASTSRENLLSSVVDIYLYMARSAGHRDQEIVFIDHLLHSMFGSDIPLYEIEQAKQSKLSLREAANFLANMLKPGDRIKLILNLISLAYHQRSQIRVLGSVEIVALADLLRLDVNLLDQIYDLFEGSAISIDLPFEISEDGTGSIKNSMLWSATGELKCAEPELHFLMIENLVLVKKLSRGTLLLKNHEAELSIDGGHYHLISPEQSLASDSWSLEYKDLWQIYRQLHSLSCLDEYLQKKSLGKNIIEQHDEYYIQRSGCLLAIATQADEHSIAKFWKEDDFWQLEALQGIEVKLNMKILEARGSFTQNSDVISLLGRNYIINRHWELIEIPLIVSDLKVQDVWHTFKEGNPALKGISFNLQKSTMTAIMGPSGSGKTTLLQVLLGEIKTPRARIQLDGKDMGANFELFQQYIAYVPQDDLLFANLSVYENLYYKLKLSIPEMKDPAEIKNRIHNLLRSVDLYEQRNMMVGDVMNKKLSGGQRRRLNIALELITGPAILILDEPTSGLSSKDSESIIRLLGELRDQGKIIISTIHQPNAGIYNSFDKLLLMDKGSVQVYFGNASAAFTYFGEELQELEDPSLNQKLKLKMPELFFDLIEHRDEAGRRLYDPEYWEKKYRDFSFMQVMQDESLLSAEDQFAGSKKKAPLSLRNLAILFRRNFLNKGRNPLNLLMTLFAAPLLALITAFVLRSSGDSGVYNYYQNQNALLFDFIAVIIFIFIGLANSIDDILGEKRIIRRELKMGISAICQLSSKHLVLFLMTCLQALLFYLVSSLVLDYRGFFWPKVLFFTLSGMTGYSLGLMFSGMIKDRSAVINILPLVIIPQIMFSGVVIEFAKMNPMLKINKVSDIPEFCHLIPSRWLVEGLVISSVRFNELSQKQKKYSELRKELISEGKMTARLSVNLAAGHQQYLEAHPPARYQNQMSSTLVNTSQGRYSRRKANAFFSYEMQLFGHELPTVWMDVVVSLFIIAFTYVITLYRLKRD